jgi:hypothetical protein
VSRAWSPRTSTPGSEAGRRRVSTSSRRAAGPRTATSALAWPRATVTPDSVRVTSHSPVSGRPVSGRPVSGRPVSGRPVSGRAGSVAWKCRVWPSPPSSRARAGSAVLATTRPSHSSTPSAANQGARPTSRPAASWASARCTAASCARRRAHQRAGRGPVNVHTGSSPTAVTASATRSALAFSHGPCWAGSSGSLPSGTSRVGTGAVARVATIWAAHRWPRPTCVASCRNVQPGQAVTGRSRSPSMVRASSAVQARSSAKKRSSSPIGVLLLAGTAASVNVVGMWRRKRGG